MQSDKLGDIMASPLEKKLWTYQDYLEETDEGEIYQIIEGELLMAPPAPASRHQFISGDLYYYLREYVYAHKLGKVAYAPIDVALDDKNVVQPDILFISKDNLGIIQERGIIGVPDVVIEILSPSTIQRDRYQKRELYEKFKVKEYWIVDIASQSIEVLRLKHDRYELHSFAVEKGVVQSSVIKGFEVELSEVM